MNDNNRSTTYSYVDQNGDLAYAWRDELTEREQQFYDLAEQHKAKLTALEAAAVTLHAAAAQAIGQGLEANDPRMIEAGLELLKYADGR
jgi:hypothetical protein